MKNEMPTERNRIDSLLQSGRLSSADHQILVEALQKKDRFWATLLEALINPFQRLSSASAIIAGGIAILAMSFIGAKLGLHYRGALDFQIIEEGKRAYSFAELLVQNAVDVICTTVFFYVGSLIARAKNLRFIDFISTTAATRVPYAAVALILFSLSPLFPSLLPRNSDVKDVLSVLALAVIAILFLTWQITLMFSALKESSGLRGKHLLAVFIIGLILAEASAYAINTLLMR